MPNDALPRSGVFAGRQPGGTDLAFVIMPFDAAFDDVYEIVRQVALDAGYECMRADEEAAPGRITDTIYQGILDASVIIADLTGKNPNVFYELGLAHAISDSVVLIVQGQDIKELPFDVGHFRVIPYVNSIGGGSRLARELGDAIGAAGATRQPRVGSSALRPKQDLGGKPERTLELAGEPTFSLVMMLDVAVKSGDEQLAHEALETLLQRRADGQRFDVDGLTTIAVNAELLGETETARAIFEETFAQYPDEEGVRLSYASFLLDLERASPDDLTLADELLHGSFQDEVRELYLRSQLALATEVDAGPIVDAMIEAYVNNPIANPAPVLLRLDQLERLDDARTVIDAWVGMNPDEQTNGQRYLAELLRNSNRQEDNAEAAEIYRHLIDNDSYSDASVEAGDMISLAIMLDVLPGGTAEAIDLARKAYAISPGDSAIRSLAAQLLATSGETEQANRILHGQPLVDSR